MNNAVCNPIARHHLAYTLPMTAASAARLAPKKTLVRTSRFKGSHPTQYFEDVVLGSPVKKK